MVNKETNIKRIGVMTSGGDAPGMNAAVRAVVRTATYYDLHVYGIMRGYDGLIKGDLKRLEPKDVGNIIHRGGTILQTARSAEFRTKEGRKGAYENIQAFDLDGIVTIGGDGTFTGATVFAEEFDFPFIGVPGTIDNDLYGTDYTIGYDTALNTAVEAVDKIRDTAYSHNRLFFVEVMGRNSGFIALNTGIATGAESVLIPEHETALETLLEKLKKDARRKKLFSLVVVAEGNKQGGAMEIAQKVKENFNHYDIKVTIIGHLQRGGNPSCLDRVLASRLGHSAVEGLMAGRSQEMAGLINQEVIFTPFKDAISKNKEPRKALIEMAEVLAI